MRKQPLRLYCFSPPVMLATFLVEITFAFYMVWRYKMTPVTRLILGLLVCLATFQATEYAICGGFGIEGNLYSRLGYGAITLLPPLGLHLAYAITGRKFNGLLAAAYASCGAFLWYFLFATQAISGQTCYANYAVFNTHQGSTILYTLYYYGWLFVSAGLALNWAAKSEKRVKAALTGLAFGYASFIIPTTLANIIDPATISGIPSIMCGFAVILAFLLVGKVAPSSIETKEAISLRVRLPF
jgi:hypothetical protein